MAPAIPDRWLDYTPIGKQIDGTRFIAFKVPLRELVNKDVEEKNRLDGNILMRTVPNLGMVIDLTNTKRYYNPVMFQKKGITYRKLMIPGHHTPPPYLVKQFKGIVSSFLRKNPENDKLIGVHCTHGVNRTGYLICNYMITELRMKPAEAIANFTIGRGHEIERENYLQSLNDLRNAYKRDRNSRPIKKKFASVDNPDFVPPTQDTEPLSWCAQTEPTIAPSPDVFDGRSRFERFREETNVQRQRYAHTDGLAPAPKPQYANKRFNGEMANNNRSNYNRRFVNTTNNHSRGGGNPYPYHHNNHHNQLTHASDAYDAQAHERKNRSRYNHDGNSGERNFNRYKFNKRV